MKQLIVTTILLAMAIGTNAFALDTASPKPSKTTQKGWTLTPEQREAMAKMHDQMASCLRSEKTLDECRNEVHKTCIATGEDSCFRMGQMGYGMMHPKGMGHGGHHWGNP